MIEDAIFACRGFRTYIRLDKAWGETECDMHVILLYKLPGCKNFYGIATAGMNATIVLR